MLITLTRGVCKPHKLVVRAVSTHRLRRVAVNRVETQMLARHAVRAVDREFGHYL